MAPITGYVTGTYRIAGGVPANGVVQRDGTPVTLRDGTQVTTR